jgi:serine/threonine-protein kinase HipA
MENRGYQIWNFQDGTKFDGSSVRVEGECLRATSEQPCFHYVASWLDMPGAFPLSQSLPLRRERFSQNECRGYSGGILPEGSNREIVARNTSISARNDYAMPKEIGGECPGAVSFAPAGEPLPEDPNVYRALSSRDVATILKELPKRPLLADDLPGFLYQRDC